MHARTGDRIIIHCSHLDGPFRDGEITGVGQVDGMPPCLGRWSLDGHTSLFFPWPGARVDRVAPVAAEGAGLR